MGEGGGGGWGSPLRQLFLDYYVPKCDFSPVLLCFCFYCYAVTGRHIWDQTRAINYFNQTQCSIMYRFLETTLKLLSSIYCIKNGSEHCNVKEVTFYNDPSKNYHPTLSCPEVPLLYLQLYFLVSCSSLALFSAAASGFYQ